MRHASQTLPSHETIRSHIQFHGQAEEKYNDCFSGPRLISGLLKDSPGQQGEFPLSAKTQFSRRATGNERRRPHCNHTDPLESRSRSVYSIVGIQVMHTGSNHRRPEQMSLVLFPDV